MSHAYSMFVQISLGSFLMMLTIALAGFSSWLMEWLFERYRMWLLREPHRPKQMLVVMVASLWVLGIVTAGVWLWGVTLRLLGVFQTMEAAIYFALVSFATLGYGDVLLDREWRIFGAMAAVNGLIIFGLLTAFLVEALRHLHASQSQVRRARKRPIVD